MNRAVQGVTLFRASDEYAVFACTLQQAVAKNPMRVLAYTVMPNHFHLLLWPTTGETLSRFMQWLTSTHAQRWHGARGSRGKGAVYQGRFQAVPVHDEASLFRVGRYVERNAVRGNLVERCDDWNWSSAAKDRRGRIELARWPVQRPADWQQYINLEETKPDLDEIRTCTAFDRPIGPERNALAGNVKVVSADGSGFRTDRDRPRKRRGSAA